MQTATWVEWIRDTSEHGRNTENSEPFTPCLAGVGSNRSLDRLGIGASDDIRLILDSGRAIGGDSAVM